MVTKTTPLTLDEFLALPETKPASEYIDGEVIQKLAPSFYHSEITSELLGLLRPYLKQSGEGTAVPELRHATRTRGSRAYLPDISVVRRENVPRDRETRAKGPIWAPPDFAIEVLSPGDAPGRVLDRMDFYLDVGVELIWVVDPDLEAVTVYRPGQQPAVHRSPGTLDARPVLSSFTVSLEDLFATLHEDEDDTGDS